MNNQIDNTAMFKNLNIKAYNLTNNIIARWDISQTIDPDTNFLTLILPSSYPVTTQSSKFANIKKNRSNFVNITNRLKFADVVAKPADVILTNLVLVPTSTQSMTTNPMTTNPMTTQPMTTQPMPVTTLSNNILQDGTTSSPSTKMYQRNFDGTSNVYSPAIYYNMEKFVPLNSLDEYYAPY